MKIRAIVVSTLILCSLFAAFIYIRAAQPGSESKLITEAMQARNTPLLIKELISKMKEQTEVDEDIFPSLIKEVETYTAECKDAAGVAVLHSMLGQMYNRYYEQNRWRIDQRTALTGYIPEDIREWSGNLFINKIKEELTASLEPAVLLQQTPASTFKEIISKGKDSPALRPTLYDFLAFRALEIQPSDVIYQQLIAYLNTQPDKKATLLAQLDYLQYKNNDARSNTSRMQYMTALDSLQQVYAKEDYAVEILNARVDLLESTPYNRTESNSVKALEYAICTEGISQYPNYSRIGLLKNRLAELQNPVLSAQTVNNVYPGSHATFTLNYKNTPEIKISIYKSLKTAVQTLTYYNPEEGKSKLGTLVKEVSFRLPQPNTYTSQDTVLIIPMETEGLYEYVLTAPGKKISVNNLFSVSRLATLVRNMPSGGFEILVTDFKSGKPIDDATVIYYGGQRRNMQQLGTAKTDRDGLAVIPANTQALAYKATKQNDTSSLLTRIYPNGTGRTETDTRTNVSLFTDRGLYRPGQTVFFKGIAYVNDTDNPHVVEGKTCVVTLQDANREKVMSKEFKTNKFGSFNGEFTIPRQTLNGMFSITTEGGSAFIRVEEYKRPGFFVEIEPLKQEVAFGDRVTLEGKVQTFSGVALQTGEVNYRINRIPFWYRSYFSPQSREQVAEGKAVVKDNGTFSFSFRPEKADNNSNDFLPYQSYQVTATMTDSKGETQETTYTFSVGETSIVLSTNLQPQMNKDTVKAIVNAKTLNNEPVTVNGDYIIWLLAETDKENEYKEVEPVADGTFMSGKAIDPAIFAALQSGRYRLQLKAKDSKGREAKTNQDFILYSLKDKRPPVFSHTWTIQNEISCLPGKEAEVLFGTSDKKAHILYEIFADNQCVERKRIELNDENRLFRIPFLESYSDGIVASFTFIKEGKSYQKHIQIVRQQPDRNLTIKPETFRDRLLPGSQETWKFRILDADSVPVAAEMLAGMYDASLDKILPFKWYFSPIQNVYFTAPRFNDGASLNQSSQYDSPSSNFINVPDYMYDRLNWQGLMDYANFNRRLRSYAAGSMKAKSMSASADIIAEEEIAYDAAPAPVITGAIKQQSMSEEPETAANGQTEQQSGLLQIRDNFNETAFFYPSLQTNQEGDIVIQFTLPESNTTWKFQALANTSDLKYGMFTKEVISSKPLMVLPNLPRFMRQGDEVTVSTQVINNSKVSLTGRVKIELFDPATDEPVVCLSKSQKPFTLAPGSTTAVAWTFPVPTTTDLLGCRIIADSDEGSDGEQHLIPVLSDKILITESTPFYLMGTGEQTIRIPEGTATSTRTPFNMTLELTANPIWYAVQALPTLTTPENQNMISWFASYYSNTLAGYIATANPRIQQVISQWKAKGGTAATLYSNLEKNEELKTILLQETPWVLAADNETEQKERLSLLFDMNRAGQQREAALQQLLQQQNEEGGWSWFKGLPGSREITLYILKGMSQLTELNAVEYGQQEKEMQIKALNFLDEQIRQDYLSLQKHTRNWQNSTPTPQQLEYLFIRSSYRDIPELGSAREAIRFYTAQAEKQWTKQSLYGKGEIALLMFRNGKKEVANTILAWLRKTATTSEQKGMYWANNRRENSYFISPIDTHCLLMNVFETLAPNREENDRMKQWLLNQKRTQNWESVPSTVNAIYTLLLTGSDWLNNNNTCTVKWGNQSFSTASGETATGYIKEVIGAKEITPEMNKITVHKQGGAPAWGAVYNQYFESIGSVTGQKGVLNVEKKLFIETNNGKEQQISPVNPDQPLRVGDKVIVRLTIRTDREMDYVFLKDLRAGCFEPANQLSRSMMSDGIWYYQSPEDVSENIYFDRLPQGTFVLEYPVYVSRPGEYSSGITTIQCLYAPEFISHTEGGKLLVEN